MTFGTHLVYYLDELQASEGLGAFVMKRKFCTVKQIQICIEFRHLGNSDCSGSWLAQLTFAVPYMAGWVCILLKLVHFPPSHIRPA